MHSFILAATVGTVVAQTMPAAAPGGFSMATLPAMCQTICGPMAQLTAMCDPGMTLSSTNQPDAQVNCVCMNQSFDVTVVGSLCQSCLTQAMMPNAELDMLAPKCMFEETLYAPQADAIVDGVVVMATAPDAAAGSMNQATAQAQAQDVMTTTQTMDGMTITSTITGSMMDETGMSNAKAVKPAAAVLGGALAGLALL